jgi:Mn-dependent DtxR family transcriptional regulator
LTLQVKSENNNNNNSNNSKNSTKKDQIEWRRNKIIELKSQGLEQIEIAAILQVSPATITIDLQYLREEAMQNLKSYTTQQLPLQFKIFVKSLHQAIQTYWRLSQEAKDDHNKIAAMEHYIDSHQTLWDLLLGGEKYDDAKQRESVRSNLYNYVDIQKISTLIPVELEKQLDHIKHTLDTVRDTIREIDNHAARARGVVDAILRGVIG